MQQGQTHVFIDYSLPGNAHTQSIFLQQHKLMPNHSQVIECSSFQCFCHDCSITYNNNTPVSLSNMDQTLTIGNTRVCVIHTDQVTIHDSFNSSYPARTCSMARTLHAILWPTLCFVVSFTCVFISLIFVCLDLENTRQEENSWKYQFPRPQSHVVIED